MVRTGPSVLHMCEYHSVKEEINTKKKEKRKEESLRWERKKRTSVDN